MRLHEVVEVLSVPAGVEVELSEAQSTARKHALEHIKGARWRALTQLQFKVGERLGIDPAPLGKQMVRALADPKKGAPKKPAPKSDADANESGTGEQAGEAGGRDAVPDRLV